MSPATNLRKWLLLGILSSALLALPISAVIIDRIAATVDSEVITLSELHQVLELRLFSKTAGENEEDFRRRVLDAMIAQILRYRDVERFGAQNVSKDAIEARLQETVNRFPSPAGFEQKLAELELTVDEVRTILQRQLQVEAYIEERFSPLIFVPLEEIEKYYQEVWAPRRRERGLAAQPLGEVREEIRDLIKAERLQTEVGKWTEQLRARANVDVYVTG